jgi:serine/threonine-protein kinase
MAAGEAVDSRADLYALGCVGYFLLTGALVFEGENAMQLILKHIRAEPVPPSVRLGRPVPAALERLLMGCLEKDPADRPWEAAMLADALGDAGAEEWTQGAARLWWETEFTPAPPRERREQPPTELLEVASDRGRP